MVSYWCYINFLQGLKTDAHLVDWQLILTTPIIRFPLPQTNLGKKRSELKHLIKERAKKLEEIKQSIKVIKVSPLQNEQLK